MITKIIDNLFQIFLGTFLISGIVLMILGISALLFVSIKAVI